MFMRITKEDIDAMNNEEKKVLLEMIWESFEEEAGYIDDEPEETKEELDLLEERLKEYEKHPESFIDGETFFKEEIERLRGGK